MSKVIENYILNEIIGSGQYGKVYSAKNMKNDQIVAIKVIKKEKFKETPKLNEFLMNEIQTLSKIENIHVVKF
jgi:serine/threonine protein kinase